MKKAVVFFGILFISLAIGNRIQQIRREGLQTVNNIARIQAVRGVPKEYVVAVKTTDFLEEPLFIQNGRALVSIGKIRKFEAGQEIKGADAKIISISGNIDLDTGMFVVRVSKNITGNFMVLRRFTGFFLPLEAELPPGARIIAQDSARMVVVGLSDGDKVVVK